MFYDSILITKKTHKNHIYIYIYIMINMFKCSKGQLGIGVVTIHDLWDAMTCFWIGTTYQGNF